jgi:hypothetical protein
MAPPEDASHRSAAMVLVFSTASIPEGLLVKGLLESEDIPVAMKGESEGPYRMGPVYLWVPEALETQARLIIEDASSTNRSEADGPPEERP